MAGGIPLSDAVIVVALPALLPFATPVALSIEAIVASLDDQTMPLLILAVDPSV